MAEGGAADLETQRSDIAALLKTALRKGDTWYLVDSRWFKQWKKYVGFDSWDKYQMGDQNVYPGPIDNSGLLKDGDCQSLKEHLIDELDYILLPTEGWNKLVSWYTLLEGQEPIARKVVEQGMFVKHCKVEVYLTELKLCENGNMNNVVTRRFSKADTIGKRATGKDMVFFFCRSRTKRALRAAGEQLVSGERNISAGRKPQAESAFLNHSPLSLGKVPRSGVFGVGRQKLSECHRRGVSRRGRGP
ncbi:ubiquitin carboxyl-terminal hydrolase 15 isoform X15 [Erythrolamprus reginae]|uniref:ubiquitin carboxyl-terminal hydrolase 15 isoform X15 n=1 Tax=Erythrolamprus reginae TaxID=121349 RepID=UPI00396C7299